MRRPGKIVVWPASIDLTRTVGQGRKLRRELCVNTPSLQELLTAADRLGLKYEVYKGAARSNSWWEKTGYILVDKGNNRKRIILERLAGEVRRLRST
ncbi:MAG: signal recognition particle subunit SRP19/SEC65 family protein [Candidatus Bathyarchaeia archaeon]